MSRKKNQKIKTLMVLDILKSHRGEDDAISTKQLILALQEEDIPCDRRTLINDIETLAAYITDNPDYDFVIRLKNTSRGNAYYTINKPDNNCQTFSEKEFICLITGINNLRLTDDIDKKFADSLKSKIIAIAPEQIKNKLLQYAADDNVYPLDTVAAKILIDSINSLTFMKGNSSDKIIDTLINLSDKDDKNALITEKNNPVYSKHSGESITLYEIDKIFRAIDSQTKISFRYFDLDENLNKIYRHDGNRYHVEPLTLIPNDNHYYLICYDDTTEMKLRTFRIDRMNDIDVKGYMWNDTMHFTVQHGDLYGVNGEPYIVRISQSQDLTELQNAAKDKNSNVYSEGDIDPSELNSFGSYKVTDEFYRFLVSLDKWDFANGRFESSMAKRMSD